jgi:hypothetical protein
LIWVEISYQCKAKRSSVHAGSSADLQGAMYSKLETDDMTK